MANSRIQTHERRLLRDFVQSSIGRAFSSQNGTAHTNSLKLHKHRCLKDCILDAEGTGFANRNSGVSPMLCQCSAGIPIGHGTGFNRVVADFGVLVLQQKLMGLSERHPVCEFWPQSEDRRFLRFFHEFVGNKYEYFNGDRVRSPTTPFLKNSAQAFAFRRHIYPSDRPCKASKRGYSLMSSFIAFSKSYRGQMKMIAAGGRRVAQRLYRLRGALCSIALRSCWDLL
jgi:hypothetical protein